MSQTISQRRKCAPKYKKAPEAPRRFKSAYMFFSTEKHKQIRDELIADGRCEKTTEIAKLVSQAWKKLSEEDRHHWEEKARQDRTRYEFEKSIYSGPWKVPTKKGQQDHPNIPRRPMSAFLAFSHDKRAEVKRMNPEHSNTHIIRRLAQLWKELNEEEKKEYIEREYTLRQKYLVDIAAWRKVKEKAIADQRSWRENFAMKQVMDGEQNVDQSLTRHPQPNDFITSNENDMFCSISSEKGVSWNPFSDYNAAHYNYFPVQTISGYPRQPDERYTSYPQPYERCTTYPDHFAHPQDYSQQGEYLQNYPSQNEHSEGEWTTAQNVNGHHSKQLSHIHNSATRTYQESGIPFPSPITAEQYAAHNEYQQVSSKRFPSYEYPDEYLSYPESERRLPDNSHEASNSLFPSTRRIDYYQEF